MNAPTGRNASVSVNRKRDLGVGATEFLRDRRQGHDDDEKIERVERPTEEAGDDRGPVTHGA